MKKSYIYPIISVSVMPSQTLCATSNLTPPTNPEIVDGNVPARKLYI